MVKINDDYLLLEKNYLFSEISRRVSSFQKENPSADLIRLGIGDVTRPLPPAVIKAMHDAVDDLASARTFRGYGPEQGYGFLIDQIVEHDFHSLGVSCEASEVFVSDGSKCDTGNIQEIFDKDLRIALMDPVYPVYCDTNVMSGRAGVLQGDGSYSSVTYLPATVENNFTPSLPQEKVDLIYLCFPNNPTGGTLSKEQLAQWVNYARENGSIILFDAAYESFIQDKDLPRSIYEIEGAREVAIEFRSFSKRLGFTGVRCAYTVVPHDLKGMSSDGQLHSLNFLWKRRQTTKFNGASYVSQRGASASYSAEAVEQIDANIRYYRNNAKMIMQALDSLKILYCGGHNAPYLWFKTPQNMKSWDFFDLMLKTVRIVGTPGVGFGRSGEGYYRLTSFGKSEDIEKACERLSKMSEFL